MENVPKGFDKTFREFCEVKDGRACWPWPIELLDPLRCNGGHELRIAPRPSQGRCDGCCSRISTGDSAHRCEDCDFDLCAQCAEKQVGRFVAFLARALF